MAIYFGCVFHRAPFCFLTAFSAARWRRPPNLQKVVRYFRTITELLCSKPFNPVVHFGSVCLPPLRLPLSYLHLLLAAFQFALALLPRRLGLIELRLQRSDLLSSVDQRLR